MTRNHRLAAHFLLFSMTQAPAHPSRVASQAATTDATTTSTRHRWLPVNREGLLYRGGVAVRALAAIVGGYLLSALIAAVLALYLPTDRLEASLTGTMVAVAVYPCVAMWMFAVRSAGRAVLGLLLPCGLLGAVVLLHFYRGASA